jgi:hypothetical protein
MTESHYPEVDHGPRCLACNVRMLVAYFKQKGLYP